MSRDPFIVLNISSLANQNEIFDAYRNLRNTYSELRFRPGEEGANACRQLEELESAYQEAIEISRSRFDIKGDGDPFVDIKEAIKSGNINQAQILLDSISNRSADWHYHQSMVFFRKEWYNDARKQLDLAVTLDPNNTVYKESLEELLKLMNPQPINNSEQGSFYNTSDPKQRSYKGTNADQQQPLGRGCSACDCCSSMLCADCCCECAGGDLISCC